MGDAVRCSNIIKQLNNYATRGGLLTSNIGLKNGVKSRSCFFCLDRLWAWIKRVSYDKNEVAKSINKAFQDVNLSHLQVSEAEFASFSRNINQLNLTFKTGSKFDQDLVEVITRIRNYVSSKATMSTRNIGADSTTHSKKPTRHSAFSLTRTPPLTQKAKPSSYMINGNPRPGKIHIPIRIPIANVSDLRLTEGNLSEIFKRANEVTLNTPYAIQSTSRVFSGAMVHRPNHNGTHSARQARHLEALFSLVEHCGSTEAQNQLRKLSKSEKLNLSLAAYFLRAGRVDESSHKNPPADDYYTRSALIYEHYATQMGEDSTTIYWVKTLIINSCKPLKARDIDIETDPKNKFGYETLTIVHELDLIRCFGESYLTNSTFKSIRRRLDYFISSCSENKDQYMNQFVQYAKDLCEVTGCQRWYDGHPGNAFLFAKSSLQGDFCWSQVRAQRIPKWIGS